MLWTRRPAPASVAGWRGGFCSIGRTPAPATDVEPIAVEQLRVPEAARPQRSPLVVRGPDSSRDPSRWFGRRVPESSLWPRHRDRRTSGRVPNTPDLRHRRRRPGRARTAQTVPPAAGQIKRGLELARVWLISVQGIVAPRRWPKRLLRRGGCGAGPVLLRQPLRQLRPSSRLDPPFDRHSDRLLLADHHDQLSAPRDTGIEKVSTEHHVVLHHHRDHDRWVF